MRFVYQRGLLALFFTLTTILWTTILELISPRINYYLSGTLLMITLIFNYFLINYLFRIYEQRQIKKIQKVLPEEIIEEQNPTSFTELSEQISDLNKKNESEIDTMKEMEIYRKQYVGNVSHELKTPLFSIQGYIETLRNGGVEDLRIRDRYLERINNSVERLLNIVNDLDMINQFESGEIILNKSKFDLNIVIKETIDLLDLEAQGKGAKLISNSNQSQIFVLADKQKISQVLTNLIANAIYYNNREHATIKVNSKITQTEVLIEVEDNGMGIPEDKLPRIFERFYRIESSRNRNAGGSGLGLAIVKHILEAHKQNILVESVYLEGTKFSFKLPLA